MFTTSFFTDSQSQFNESQEKLAQLWQGSQKQLSESQKKLFYNWVETLRSGATQLTVAESVEKALNFQKELIDSTLNAQQVAAHLILEGQKQFWDNYFQAARQITKTN